MKKQQIFSTFAFILFSVVSIAQNTTTTDFLPGAIINFSNEKTVGTIKPLFKQRGVVQFVSNAGKKTQYSPNEILGFELNGDTYTTFGGDFYKIISKGVKMQLLLRVTDNSGKIYYNGAQAITNPTVAGKIGDWYLQRAGNDNIWQVSSENLVAVAETAFGDCETVLSALKNKQITYEQLAKAIESYNSCK